RLGQKIVRSQPQPPNPVADLALGSQDEYRRPIVALSNSAQHAEPVAIGQTQIEHHGLVFAASQRTLGAGSVPGMVDHETALGESTCQPVGELLFVFNKKYVQVGL